MKNNKEIKKEKKNIMKGIKILTIVLAIILVSMVSFFGVYVQNKNIMENKVADYQYAMDLNGARTIKLEINEEESDDVKTEENYKTAKSVIEKRLKTVGVQEDNISVNTSTGAITIEIPENTSTDSVVSNLNTTGKFEIIDTETEEVLLNNDDIKSSSVLYNTISAGTTVYLEIAFNKEGKEKLNEISRTYVPADETTENTTTNETATNDVTVNEVTTNETSNETTTNEVTTNEATTEETNSDDEAKEKTITMKIDDEEIMTTSFDEPLTTGVIQLSVGSATTDTTTLQDYITQAQNVATVLDSGKLPIKYDITKNQYVLSNIEQQDLLYIALAVSIITLIGIIILIIKYKTNGLLAGIAYIGLAAIYMLIIRYANVTISIPSIFATIAMLILNYIFTIMLLKNIKINKEEQKENAVNKATSKTYIDFFIRIIPVCIIVIAFCFIQWTPISSFGMISFWGLAIIAIYNAIITRYLLKIKM